MPWGCTGCGEEHDDAFDACWRCGAERPAHLSRSEVELEPADLAAPSEAQNRFTQAVIDYQRDSGWYPTGPEDKWIAAANGLHRLRVAYQLYRRRQDSHSRGRPDLDRLWTHFFLAMGVGAGVATGVTINPAWLNFLFSNDARFALVYGVVMLAILLTGRRAVRQELRAAAEAAVRKGELPTRSVT